MDEQLKPALKARLLAMADDELILGHRDSEWTGHVPILEEDIAFSNIAQDELGHAQLWYRLLQDLSGQEPDRLVFFRETEDFRNIQMVELPKGDWAFTIVRQYLFDAAEAVWLSWLTDSQYRPLAETAAKIRPEEIYHGRHGEAWMLRLAQGTEESHHRMQVALDQLWAPAFQLFEPLEGDPLLEAAGFFPAGEWLKESWLARVSMLMESCGLRLPEPLPQELPGRDEHTPHLSRLVGDLQAVARLEPEAQW